MTRQVWSFSLLAVTACLIIGSLTSRTHGQSCTFTVTPASISTSATSTAGVLSVAASDASCTWSASSNATWLGAQVLYGYPGQVLKDGATAYWRLDESTGSTRVTDVTGHSITGRILGAATLQQTGALQDSDAAMLFDGSTAHLATTPSAALTFTSSMSAEVWLKTTSTATQRIVQTNTWTLDVDSSARLSLTLSTGGVSQVQGTASLTDGQWHHVVATWDGTTARVYVDGTVDGVASISGTLATTTDGVTVGRDNAGGSYTNGSLDEIALYPQALTATQISQHYALRTASANVGSGAVAYAIAGNAQASSRTAALTVAGQTIPVSQSGLTCSYAVSPTTMSLTSGGGPAAVGVTTTDASCAWTRSNGIPWITAGSALYGYRGQVIADGPVGYWRLDESAGPTFADATGHGLSASASGTVTLQQPGALADGSAAALFDGLTASGSVTSSPLLTSPTMSSEAWIKTSAAATDQRLMQTGPWTVDVHDTARLTLRFTGGSSALVAGTTSVTDGQWHHIVATWDGALARIYVDGVIDGESPATGALVANATGLTLAADPAATAYLHGTLDEVAVYARPLNPTEVARHYALASVGSTTTGSGAVTVTLAANPRPTARTATIVVAGQTISVAQDANPHPFAIAMGDSFALAVDDDGTVWTWGNMGVGSPSSVPVQVSALSGIIAVAAGSNHALALKSDGTVWSWGTNSSGQVGNGTTTTQVTPVQISGLTGVVAIAAGWTHSMALKSDGTVWAWGLNSSGQIGDGSTTPRLSPVQVTSLSTLVKAIAARFFTSLAVKTDGTVWVWGDNQTGEVGNGTTSSSPTTTPTQASPLSGATTVSAGSWSSFAWDATGALSAWGDNPSGQLGDGTNTRRTRPVSLTTISSVAALQGLTHTIAAKYDGTLWTWGLNQQGQLGDGTPTTHWLPAQVPGVDGIVAVAAGTGAGSAVSADGRVWTWGNNVNGQLGDGTVDGRLAPVQIADAGMAWHVGTPRFSLPGGNYSSAVNVTVSDVSAGATIHYTTTGVDPIESDPTITSGAIVAITQTTTLKARAWRTGSPASNIAAATYTLTVPTPTFAPNGALYTTAQNVTIAESLSGTTIRYTTDGSAPTASSTLYTAAIPINTATTLKAIALKAGWTTSAVASTTYSFNYGTLATPTFTPAPAQIGYGSQVSIAATSFATIRYTTNGATPTATSPVYTGPITITGTTTLLAKAFHPDWTTSAQGGGQYTVKVGATTFSPGAGTYAAGTPVTVTNATPGAVIHYTLNGVDPTASDPVVASGGTLIAGNFKLKARAFLTGWTSSDVTTAAYAVTGSFTNWNVAAGLNHSAALKNDGTVWTWGANGSGQLGNGGTTDQSLPGIVTLTGIVALAVGDDHTIAVTNSGVAWTWGSNASGQLGDGGTQATRSQPYAVPLTNVTAVSAGAAFSVALKSDGTVWAWGANDSGQLGDGSTTPHSQPAQVSGLTNVVAIAAGGYHVLARKNDGSVWAWGRNSDGELADGTPTQRNSPVNTASSATVIGAGKYHSLGVNSNGTLSGWGANGSSQLGVVGMFFTTSPTVISGLSNVARADGGSDHSVAVMTNGSVAAWGQNNAGQVGDGTTNNTRTTPTLITGLSNIGMASAGGNHTLAVTTDGAVFAWGVNTYGQLGDGTLDSRTTPTAISLSQFQWKTSTPRLAPQTGTYSATTTVTLTAITTGAQIHYTTNGVDPTSADPVLSSGATLTIDQTTTLKAMATAAGVPDSNVNTAVYTMALPTPGISPATGTYATTQQVTLTSPIAGATIRYTLDGTDPTATSSMYAGALTVDATTTLKARLYRAGWTDGPIGVALYTMKAITPTLSPTGGSYGSPATVAITSSTPSTIITYTTDGSEPTTFSPTYTTPVSINATATVRATAWRAGWVPSDSAVGSFWITQGTVATPSIAPAASAGPAPVDVSITCATAGATIRYTLDGSDPTANAPAYIGPFTIAVTTTVKAKAFKAGYTASAVASVTYALDTTGAVDTPTLVPGGGWFTTSRTVTVAVQSPGAVIHYTTTGADPTEADPTITSGTTVTVDRSMVLKAKAWSTSAAASGIRREDYVVTGAVAVGGSSSYALKADGTVQSWGDNSSGQLGDGTQTQRLTPAAISGLSNVVAIAAGYQHALAVKADGTVWAWGANTSGQLGDGTNTQRTTPVQVVGVTNAVAVAAGDFHSLALTADGRVWVWGSNQSGQIGDGSMSDRWTPLQLPGLIGVRRISAGSAFSLAAEDDGTGIGTVWAWGANTYGQLGDGSTLTRLVPVRVATGVQSTTLVAGRDFSIAITGAGALVGWGRNDVGQLGDSTGTNHLSPASVSPLPSFIAVAAGSVHSIAVTRDGRVFTSGLNNWRQLGDPSVSSRTWFQAIDGASALLAIASAPSALHSVGLRPDGTVLAWGSNTNGRLGDGTVTTTALPVSVSGVTVAANSWLTSDADQDGLLTWREYLLGTDPLSADTNRDGMRDGTEIDGGLSPTSPDLDGDGVANWVEIAQGTDPLNPDTDGDGVADGVDVFPLDPTRSAPLPSNPNDHTPPIITLIEPTNARRIS